MTATITPTGKERHRVAPPVVPMVLLAVALLLGVGSVVSHPAPVGRSRPAAVRTLPGRPATVPAAPTTSTVPVTTVPSTTPTTTPPPVVPAAVAVAPVTTTAPPTTPGTGCAAALAYLAAHEAPGYANTCAPGSALGHYGYTCANVPGRCDGVRIVHIACPAPFVYMNEAHNSWVVIGQGSGIDPYGQGTPAEQSYCNSFR